MIDPPADFTVGDLLACLWGIVASLFSAMAHTRIDLALLIGLAALIMARRR